MSNCIWLCDFCSGRRQRFGHVEPFRHHGRQDDEKSGADRQVRRRGRLRHEGRLAGPETGPGKQGQADR